MVTHKKSLSVWMLVLITVGALDMNHLAKRYAAICYEIAQHSDCCPGKHLNEYTKLLQQKQEEIENLMLDRICTPQHGVYTRLRKQITIKKVLMLIAIPLAAAAAPAFYLSTTHAMLETLISLHAISNTTVAPIYVCIIAAIAAIGFTCLTLNTLFQIIKKNLLYNTYRRLKHMDSKKRAYTIITMSILTAMIIFSSVFTLGMTYKMSLASLPQIMQGSAVMLPKVLAFLSSTVSVISEAIFSFANTLSGVLEFTLEAFKDAGKQWLREYKHQMRQCWGEFQKLNSCGKLTGKTHSASKSRIAARILFCLPTLILSNVTMLLASAANWLCFLGHCTSVGIAQNNPKMSFFPKLLALSYCATATIAITEASADSTYCIEHEHDPIDAIRPSTEGVHEHIMIPQRCVYALLYLPFMLSTLMKSAMHEDSSQRKILSQNIRAFEAKIGAKVGKYVIFSMMLVIGVGLITGAIIAAAMTGPGSIAAFISVLMVSKALLITGSTLIAVGAASLITTSLINHDVTNNDTECCDIKKNEPSADGIKTSGAQTSPTQCSDPCCHAHRDSGASETKSHPRTVTRGNFSALITEGCETKKDEDTNGRAVTDHPKTPPPRGQHTQCNDPYCHHQNGAPKTCLFSPSRKFSLGAPIGSARI